MSRKQQKRQRKNLTVSDGLDEVADLASAVANSVHESTQGLESHEAQNFANFATYPSTSSVLPLSTHGDAKNSLPTFLIKSKEFTQGKLKSVAELQHSISSRRLVYSERTPLLPLHSSPEPHNEETHDEEPQAQSFSSSRAIRLAAGLAIVVSVGFLTVLWLCEEIMIAWRSAGCAVAKLAAFV
ncbi:hypothetical protein METBIDRAFT_208357 [Metschnikowia bicuspidata var. bicuspidata NRRL YB-4993]|uniref:Uncharacterized protein n=1 Tax=Metschnikowia bicuspidata var. bicuspidata NRRL YB-4993 TaxID=869754 RepID=A0A1A0H6Z6_9ASCO|nr:hypothetical protein METBIDRAFT_208357 [Metschnikowia bicuspidata var. bicuspidata NRRL YB-4993]OBA19806.1 hypothetical protein METBIDRAFT_208357 [Metschnikowia bicuspidata var. bicuspidata NRRL YB-4993]